MRSMKRALIYGAAVAVLVTSTSVAAAACKTADLRGSWAGVASRITAGLLAK